MRRRIIGVMLLAATLCAAQLPSGWNALNSEFQEGLREPWYLQAVPRLELEEEPALPDPEVIEGMIDALVEVERPGPGYAGTVHAWQFLPGPGQRGARSMLLLDDYGLEEHPVVAWLEQLGPHSLPHLLEHLDDPRETRSSFGPEDRPGGFLWLERRIQGNPLNPREARVLGEHVFPRWSSAYREGGEEATHTLRVGDLCLVALGQIVNRPSYLAVRYQPSGHVVVTSPVHDPWLAEALREVWGGARPRRLLLDSLLRDLHTRGSSTDELQAGAAMRLACYFPRETAGVLVRRLDGLHVGHAAADFYDGVRPEALLEALAPCEFPPIAAAVERAPGRAGAPPVLEAYLGERPTPGRRLRAAWREGGEQARRAFAEALGSPDVETRVLACRTLHDAPGERSGMLGLLRPLLEDERPTGGSFAARPPTPFGGGSDDIRAEVEDLYSGELVGVPWDDPDPPYEPLFPAPRHLLRVCDEAGRAVSSIVGEEFRLAGDEDERDAALSELIRLLGG